MKTETKPQRGFTFSSPSGSTMMEVEHIDREDGKLRMKGKMMGEFPQDVFLTGDQFIAMMTMSLRPSLLLFAATVPLAAALRCLKGQASPDWDSRSLLVVSLMLALVVLTPVLLPLLAVVAVLGGVTFLFLAAVRALRGSKESTPPAAKNAPNGWPS